MKKPDTLMSRRSGRTQAVRHCQRKNCRGIVGAKTCSPAPDGRAVLLDVCDNCGREYGLPYFAPPGANGAPPEATE
jgi:hypothetical protein